MINTQPIQMLVWDRIPMSQKRACDVILMQCTVESYYNKVIGTLKITLLRNGLLTVES